MKKLLVLCAAVCVVCALSGCSSSTNNNAAVPAPDKISTLDEAKIEQDPYAIEESPNVNGMRYNLTLEQFSLKYNEMLKEMGSLEMINGKGWQKNGEATTDLNGTQIQYYYYDAMKINFTATVEVQTNKIMNIGLGTTMSNYVSIENGKSYSDTVLMKSAVMAAAAGGYTIDMVNVLQDVFYKTTFEKNDEIWYDGSVYCLSTSEDKGNSERSTMLFRVFPVKDELKNEWNIVEYEEIEIN